MQNVLMVLSTFPDRAVARQIGTVMVERQLAACVNLISGVESIYRWQNQVETSEEILAIFKTTREAHAQFCSLLQELHPYEVPEIIAIAPDEIHGSYLEWWLSNVAPKNQ